jgi:hypothetical protein
MTRTVVQGWQSWRLVQTGGRGARATDAGVGVFQWGP